MVSGRDSRWVARDVPAACTETSLLHAAELTCSMQIGLIIANAHSFQQKLKFFNVSSRLGKGSGSRD